MGPAVRFLVSKHVVFRDVGSWRGWFYKWKTPAMGNQKPFERSCYGIEKFHAFHEFLPWEQFSHKEGISKGDEN